MLESEAAAPALPDHLYFTGKPCKRGHVAPRYKSSAACMKCSAAAALVYAAADPVKKRAHRKKFYRRRVRRDWSAILIEKAASRARDRGLEFTIDKAWGRARWTGRCEVTGITFELGDGGRSPYSASIDRIDNDRGYTTDNCRFVIWGFNRMKGSAADHILNEIMQSAVALSRSQDTIGFCA